MKAIGWSDLRAAVVDLRRTWPQLILIDLLARATTFIAVTLTWPMSSKTLFSAETPAGLSTGLCLLSRLPTWAPC